MTETDKSISSASSPANDMFGATRNDNVKSYNSD